MLFIDRSKMARIRINTRTHTKEKPHLINSYFFFKIGKAKKSTGWAKYVYVCQWDMCWRNFCNFSLVTKNVKSRSKMAFFQMSAILKFDFQKREQLRFSEVNYLNCTKKTQFLHVATTFSLKQGERTSHGPIPHPLMLSSAINLPVTLLTKLTI